MKRKFHDDTDASSKTAVPVSKRTRRHTHCGHPNDQPPISIPPRYPRGNFQIDRWPPESRLASFNKDWFQNRHVLDIGCNCGFMTLALALVFRPLSIVGIDVDENLIKLAMKNLSLCQQMVQEQRLGQRKESHGQRPSTEYGIFPVSIIRQYGPISAPSIHPSAVVNRLGFCESVRFKCKDYVGEQEDSKKIEEFDTILALNVTKWIHLNYGDDGVKRMFKKIFAQLRPGGLFILDAQPWNLYKRNLKELGDSAPKIEFKPHVFKEYLLSDHVGFSSCHVAASESSHLRVEVRRSLLVFEKSRKSTQ